ncbi:MAG: prepilin-type N-terminal cleavage/methylation domain-containing protein [candidate division Zixibacteria bacterium]|nr:prepilin-type N-terminal cleavage/methylation domain-containing protein [candidate division Zixibacteria bacterium]
MVLNKLNSKKGFTLIELMIVVVIIGILAALAIPRFMTASTRAKQSEAKQLLKQVYTMQHSYRQANATYGDGGVTAASNGSFPQIGVEIMNSALYTYVMVSAANTFTCTATANLDDDATNDVWTVNQLGTLTNTTNDAAA